MELISSYMISRHRDCDAAFVRAEKAAGAADWPGLELEAGGFFAKMERHIAAEEELLFPAFEERTGMAGAGPTAVMRMEHEQIRSLFADMRAAMESRDAKQQYLGAAQTLRGLLQQHNAKDENMMYPMLDQALGEDAAMLFGQLRGAMA